MYVPDERRAGRFRERAKHVHLETIRVNYVGID
jgi:hypothetical protein